MVFCPVQSLVGRLAAQCVLRLEDGIAHELPGMFVFKAVQDSGPVLARGDHPRQPHIGQVLGYGGRDFPTASASMEKPSTASSTYWLSVASEQLLLSAFMRI